MESKADRARRLLQRSRHEQGFAQMLGELLVMLLWAGLTFASCVAGSQGLAWWLGVDRGP